MLDLTTLKKIIHSIDLIGKKNIYVLGKLVEFAQKIVRIRKLKTEFDKYKVIFTKYRYVY